MAKTHNREHELKAINGILKNAVFYQGKKYLVGKTIYRKIGISQHAFDSVVTSLQQRGLLGPLTSIKDMPPDFPNPAKTSFSGIAASVWRGKSHLCIKVAECFTAGLKQRRQELKDELKREGLLR